VNLLPEVGTSKAVTPLKYVKHVGEVFGVISGIQMAIFPLEYHRVLRQTQGDIIIML
jgi:hypothetical protein